MFTVTGVGLYLYLYKELHQKAVDTVHPICWESINSPQKTTSHTIYPEN